MVHSSYDREARFLQKRRRMIKSFKENTEKEHRGNRERRQRDDMMDRKGVNKITSFNVHLAMDPVSMVGDKAGMGTTVWFG